MNRTGSKRSRFPGAIPGAVLALSILLLVSVAHGAGEVERIAAVLDDFHAAAAEADEERYFSHFAPNGVFLGTDAGERWGPKEFRGFVHPYFAAGKGWTYTPRERQVRVAADGRTAWFDELLDNASYGVCRGSGVLQRYGEEWKIEQYNLSIPMPNDLAKEFVARIREYQGSKPED